MRLPDELQLGIDQLLEKCSSKALTGAREELSSEYREGKASSFHDETKRLAYLAARMPATYAAVHKVLQNVPLAPRSLIDLGAGPAAASWAAVELFPSLEEITLIEKSPEAIALGKRLAERAANPLCKARWIERSLPGEIEKAEMGILSYAVGEMKEVEKLINECWQNVSTLVVIEPGTMQGAARIRAIRKQLIDLGAHLIAPCPHSLACPSDWCHFSARVERTRLHRQLKGGTLGYEDEKFSYVIGAKSGHHLAQNRIIRHPMKGSGHVRLTLCTQSGHLEERVITKKTKELYKQARDAEWGDQI